MDQNFNYNAPNEEQPPFQGFENVPSAPESTAHKGFSVASLVLGIVSICSFCCCCCGLFFVPLICGILAIVFAIIAAKKAPDKKMPGMAIAGLILGIIAVVVSILFFLLLILSVPTASDAEFWAEYEEALREELGDEMFEEYFGDLFNELPVE